SGDSNFGLCGHSRCKSGNNFACDEWAVINTDAHKFLSCLAFDTPILGNSPVRYGIALFNLGLDLKMPAFKDHQTMNIRPDAWTWNSTTRNFSHLYLVGRLRGLILTFMPHIDISVAGGLRCHPTMNIEQQIEEVLRDILKKPRISLTNNLEEISQ
ncbi:MAG: hypothetical protein NZT61_04515, partial [Deltaproteobacteria bacterium]|nr:hypothetical protein [Deltaproteobacteria bacterium]